KDLVSFGTDEDKATIQGFRNVFPKSIHLLCYIHVRKRIKLKLHEWKFSKDQIRTILSNIFGSDGIIDASDEDDLKKRLQQCNVTWNQMEKNNKIKLGTIYDWLMKYKFVSFNNMITAGNILGNRFRRYDQNCNESINQLVKQDTGNKKMKWPEFNEELRKIVISQQDEVIKALFNSGTYELDPDYKCNEIDQYLWYSLDEKQRKSKIESFKQSKVKSSHSKGKGTTITSMCKLPTNAGK